MYDIPSILQLPVGVAIGATTVVAPWMLRPFLITAFALLGIQGLLLYADGGSVALATGLAWLTTMAKNLGLLLGGIGVGRVVSQVLFGRG